MGVGGRINDDETHLVTRRLLDGVHQLMLRVALHAGQYMPGCLGLRPGGRVDICQ